MSSDFAAARVHLDRAYHYLQGNDEISRNARDALDIVMEAVIVAECRKESAQIISFPNRRSSSR